MPRTFLLLTFNLALNLLFAMGAGATGAPKTFKAFPAQSALHLEAPDLHAGSKFWDFRTRIREGARTNGVTVGGKYTLVTWGCGAPCQGGVVIDRTKSKDNIIALPVAALGYAYSFDSSLLIANPHPEEYDSTGEIPTFLYREFYQLVDGTFKFICADKGEGTRCIDEKEYNAAVNAIN